MTAVKVRWATLGAPLLAAAMTAVGLAAETRPPRSGRTGETVITSSRLEYDYQESVILFEENVKVKDPQFTLTADRVLVFLEGTNALKQVRAMGNVVMTSSNRSARCSQAVYTKADGKIVMTGETVVLQRAMDQIWGKQITIWVNDQRMECQQPRMVIQPSSMQDGGQLLP